MLIDAILTIVAMAAICFCFIAMHISIKKKPKNNECILTIKTNNTVSEHEETDTETCEEVTVLIMDENNGNKPKTITLTDVVSGEKYKCNLVNNQIYVGRTEVCDIQILKDKAVSRVHCIVECDDEGIISIWDNNSLNGTFLNDTEITATKCLKSGDTLQIGRFKYEIQVQ